MHDKTSAGLLAKCGHQDLSPALFDGASPRCPRGPAVAHLSPSRAVSDPGNRHPPREGVPAEMATGALFA